MFAYINKKISLPGQSFIKCFSWSIEHGFIACGGENGLLKIFKLEPDTTLDKQSNDNFQKKENVISNDGSTPNLSMNQTLEGHSNDVLHVAWNEKYEKLASSDENGLIIVWLLYKGSWYEEMVNNRNKSTVIDMKWTLDGQRICIVYEDGSVIVGAVDGDRLWTKEIKAITLTCLEWSPDSRYLLFGSQSGQIHCYDSQGNFTSKITIVGRARSPGIESSFAPAEDASIVALRWYSCETEEGVHRAQTRAHHLAIALSNGQVQLLRNELDEKPIIINTGLQTIMSMQWNAQATVITVCGIEMTEVSSKSDNQSKLIKSSKSNFQEKNEKSEKRVTAKFICPITGELLHTLLIPGQNLSSCCWEKSGLRIAFSIDASLFIAQVQPHYIWTHFGDTLAFSLNTGNSFSTLLFCQLRTGKYSAKSIVGLTHLASSGQYCVLATDRTMFARPGESMECALFVCNSIGTSVDTVNLDLRVRCLAMNNSRVIAASTDAFCIWRFRRPWSGLNTSDVNSNDSLDPLEESEQPNHSNQLSTYDRLFNVSLGRGEVINALCCSEKILLIALRTGQLLMYQLPSAVLCQRISCNSDALIIHLQLNSESNRVLLIDAQRELIIMDLEQSPPIRLPLQAKQVWQAHWSADSADWLVYLQRGKLYVQNVFVPRTEASITHTNGYICRLADLQILIALLDPLLLLLQKMLAGSGEILKPSDFIQTVDTELLAQVRIQLNTLPLNELSTFIEQHSHPRLWRLLAQSALQRNQWQVAELGFVREKDVHGLQFVRRLIALASDELRTAEVHVYFGRPLEAEKVYLEVGRPDLAVQMWSMLGEWSRVWQLTQDAPNGGGLPQEQVRIGLAQQLMEKSQFSLASEHFVRLNDLKGIVNSCILAQEFDKLVSIVRSNLIEDQQWTNVEIGEQIWPDTSSDWTWLAGLLESLGECELASQCYLRADLPQQAIDCCVRLNEWILAIHLAKEHHISKVDQLLAGYAVQLTTKRQWFDAVQLYAQADKHYLALKVLLKVICEVRSFASISTLKRLYVLVGLLSAGKQKSETLSTKINQNNNFQINSGGSKTLENLLSLEESNSELIRLDENILRKKEINSSSKTKQDSNEFHSLNVSNQIATETNVIMDNADTNSDLNQWLVLEKIDTNLEQQLLMQPWRGAEAIHFYILAQQQLQDGYVDAAMHTALLLMDYEQFLPPLQIYELIALTAAINRKMDVCSNAFIRLEALEQQRDNGQKIKDLDLLDEQKGKYARLALTLFSKQPPKQSRISSQFSCPVCENALPPSSTHCFKCDTHFAVCVASGRPILDTGVSWTCSICSHKAIRADLVGYNSCPLCHHII